MIVMSTSLPNSYALMLARQEMVNYLAQKLMSAQGTDSCEKPVLDRIAHQAKLKVDQLSNNEIERWLRGEDVI